MQKTLKARSFRQMTLGQWKKFCAEAHASIGQMYGKHKYPYHLNRVDEVLVRFGHTQHAYRVAGQGHDLPEDVKLTRAYLLNGGISWLALLGIWGVTDEPGATRAARKRRTLPKTARYRIAIIVKLADRIANVEENIRTGFVTQFEKYAREFPDLMKYLRNRFDQGAERMWKHLEWLFEKGRELMKAFACGERVVGIPA